MNALYFRKQSVQPASRAGFTLVEMMITAAIFSIVVLGIIGLQLYAMKVYTLGATMVSATMNGRQTLNQIRDRVRAASTVYVGNYNPSSGSGFVQVPIGSLQQGNALMLSYTNLPQTNYLIFYQDARSTNIYYFSNNLATAYTNTTIKTLANFVTNYYCFFAEDYQGNVLTNYLKNPVIHVTMNFYQWQFPIGIIGGNAVNSFNFYHLNTRIDRRVQ